MGRRSALLITGLVVAVLGTLLVFLYTNNVQQTVNADGELVEVYVASSAIPVGTPAEDAAGVMVLQAVPAGTVPAGGITAVDDLADQFAILPIFEGQVVLASMFGEPSEVTSLAIPEGQMGVAVQLDDAQRVAGFVIPGSEVAVFSTVETAEGQPTTRLLLDRATVAAVGPTTVVSRTTGSGETANTEEIPTAILTLALDQAEAEKLIHGQQQTQLHFALLTPTSVTAPGNGVNDTTLFAG